MEYLPAKTIVTRTRDTAWFGCDYNMNIYRGCSHGCIYCDSRSSCYGIADFDTVHAKADALRIIRDDLRRKVRRGVVATGAMSDPYNPQEEAHQLTRHALELLAAYGFGVAIATKSTLITRDLDILQEIKRFMPVLAKLTITTTDDALARRIEPGAPPPSARLSALHALTDAGIFSGILLMPVLPFLTDSTAQVLSVVEAAARVGARFIYPAFGMTLRSGMREYFYAKLDAQFPGLREQYERQYGSRYFCPAPRAKQLWSAFAAACDKHGILYQMPDIIRAYKLGYDYEQLTLFS